MTEQNGSSAFAETLRALPAASSNASDFRARFVELSLRVTQGREAVLLAGVNGDALKPVAQALLSAADESADREIFAEFARLAAGHGSASGEGAGDFYIATKLEATPGGLTVAVVRLAPASSDGCQIALARLEMAAAGAAVSESSAQLVMAREERERFAGVLELMVALEEATKFHGAAMLVCNHLAAQFAAGRVSLGWLHGHEAQVEAVSHADHFERKSEAVKALAAAMEEAIDQDDEIAFPQLPDSMRMTRAHAIYVEAQRTPYLLSLPLRREGEPIGAILLEREAGAFSLTEMRCLRLAADHAAPRLESLRRARRWFGARLADWLLRSSAGWLGPEHTGWKLAALALLFAFIASLVIRPVYRIGAPFVLRSDAVAMLPAPFDAYIDEVRFRVGDSVAAGQPLLLLNTRDLALDEASLLAEQRGYAVAAQKAQSADDIAEMQIAAAKGDQAGAKLALTRYRLSQATIKAPFAGEIAEGDLRERLGAPVKQGEVLVKLARVSELYAEANVDERDLNQVRPGATGELAFEAQPDWHFPIRVERIDPAATVTEKGNAFTVRCVFVTAPEWWRPGMSGLCKIESERRSLLWIATHRTTAFLRMHLWW